MIYDERRHKLVSDLYKRQTVFDFERAVSGEDFGGERDNGYGATQPVCKGLGGSRAVAYRPLPSNRHLEKVALFGAAAK